MNFSGGQKPGSIIHPVLNIWYTIRNPHQSPAIMKIPDHFLRYFLIAAGLLILGILFVIVQTAVMNPDLAPLNATELQARADHHSLTVMPFMARVYPKLLFLNAGVALFILMVPLFWVWVWWFRRDLLDTMIMLMQGTVCLLMWALGHNSFTRIYITLPAASMADDRDHVSPPWLAGDARLCPCRDFRVSLYRCPESIPAGKRQLEYPPPGDICLFILGRAWKAGLVIFFLMAIAAAIECWVTPVLVKSAFDAALLTTL